MNDPFPELNNEQWNQAHESAIPHGLHGLTKALHLTTTGIANARSQIGTNISYLKRQVEILNTRLDEFNKSSQSLSEKALNLTRWIMIATMISSLATALLAVDVIRKWYNI